MPTPPQLWLLFLLLACVAVSARYGRALWWRHLMDIRPGGQPQDRWAAGGKSRNPQADKRSPLPQGGTLSDCATFFRELAALQESGLVLTHALTLAAGTEHAPDWCRRTLNLLDSGMPAPEAVELAVAHPFPGQRGKRGNQVDDESVAVGFTLSAALSLSTTHGVAAAPLLRHIARRLDHQNGRRQALDKALASPRSTAVVLLLLPPAALFMAFLSGLVQPEVLLGSSAALLSILVGVAFLLTGMFWARLMIEKAKSRIC